MNPQTQQCLAKFKPHFENVTEVMEAAFRELEANVPAPVPIRYMLQWVPRYKEKSAQQAIIQKLARYISGLNALTILLSHGYGQEQGVLQRTLDEIGEDIMFLMLPSQNTTDEDLKSRYLKAFYQEEFEEGVAPIDSKLRRDQIPRRKIRAFLERQTPGMVDNASSVMSRTYSGFVHSASPHIMDMCDRSGRFQVKGDLHPGIMISHIEDAWNYYYRGLMTTAGIATHFGKRALYGSLTVELKSFEKLQP